MAGTDKYDTQNQSFEKRYVVQGDSPKEQTLAATGLSTILYAFDKKLKKDIVMKILNPFREAKKGKERVRIPLEGAELESWQQRFLQEAEITSQLNHNNIVNVYDFGIHRLPDRKLYYIIMDYVPGNDLQSAVRFVDTGKKSANPKKKLFVTYEEACLLFEEFCHPIGYAHKKNVIHRDLKLGNILVSKKGDFYICDFGLAKIKAGDGEESEKKAGDIDSTAQITVENPVVTAEHTVLGTFEYITPEQIRGDPVSRRTDVYLMTAAFYHFLRGKPPFSSKDFDRRRYDNDHSFDMPKFPRGLKKIIAKGMQVKPEHRFKSIQELQEAIREYRTRKPGLFSKAPPEQRNLEDILKQLATAG